MSMKKETWIMSAIVLGVIGIGFFLIKYGSRNPDIGTPVDPQSLVRETSHMTGNKNAKVSVVEFGDYQCPACGAANPIVSQVIAAYRDNPDFNFVFRHFPLPSHRNALAAAAAAEAAGEQEKFWEMHDRIYTGQAEWAGSGNPPEIFAGYARDLGLDVDKFTAAAGSGKFTDLIRTDQADGQSAGVNATPSFFIGGVKYPRVLDFETFESLIDAELAR